MPEVNKLSMAVPTGILKEFKQTLSKDYAGKLYCNQLGHSIQCHS